MPRHRRHRTHKQEPESAAHARLQRLSRVRLIAQPECEFARERRKGGARTWRGVRAEGREERPELRGHPSLPSLERRGVLLRMVERKSEQTKERGQTNKQKNDKQKK